MTVSKEITDGIEALDRALKRLDGLKARVSELQDKLDTGQQRKDNLDGAIASLEAQVDAGLVTLKGLLDAQ